MTLLVQIEEKQNEKICGIFWLGCLNNGDNDVCLIHRSNSAKFRWSQRLGYIAIGDIYQLCIMGRLWLTQG